MMTEDDMRLWLISITNYLAELDDDDALIYIDTVAKEMERVAAIIRAYQERRSKE